MRKGRPSPQLPSLLNRHDLCWFLALSIPTHRSSIWVFISQIDGVYRQRRLVADIMAIDPRAHQVRWRNNTFGYKNLMLTPPHCDCFCSRLLRFGLIIHSRLAIILFSRGCSVDFSYIQHQRNSELCLTFRRRWRGLQYIFSDRVMYEHGYPFRSSSKKVRV